jgi:hypothetical protein
MFWTAALKALDARTATVQYVSEIHSRIVTAHAAVQCGSILVSEPCAASQRAGIAAGPPRVTALNTRYQT